MVRVGINGFGRIGRNFFRAAQGRPELEIVAANDITSPEILAHLLRYDSILGRFPGQVVVEGETLLVDGRPLRVFSGLAPGELDWAGLGVEVVIESSGVFTTAEQASPHLGSGGARKVIVTAPAGGEDLTVCIGVNQERYDPQRHHLISNASCTTNCLAVVAKVLHQRFGIASGLMSTAHAYTGDQRLLDGPHSDLRRARAAAMSLIPTSSGAAKAVELVLPELRGRFQGSALRVPVPDVSLVDFSAVVERPTSVEAVNRAFQDAAAGELQGILRVSEEPLVSIDFIGDSCSAIVDAPCTLMAGDHHVKVMAWYDNEWGYSCRVVDLAVLVAETLPSG
ncbi:MAG: type I glyceraldehyde-3-phosphate dehydrogenase [Candidatus Dormibacteria bacterium]